MSILLKLPKYKVNLRTTQYFIPNFFQLLFFLKTSFVGNPKTKKKKHSKNTHFFMWISLIFGVFRKSDLFGFFEIGSNGDFYWIHFRFFLFLFVKTR